VKNRYLALSLFAIITIVSVLFAACRKINESTDIGQGLIPPIDNINTFDTTIDVLAFNDTISQANDTVRLNRSQEHFVGIINNDIFFGRSDAKIFFELKPVSYTTYPFARPDSVKIDSIVLVLGFVEAYGDTVTPQQLSVYEINQNQKFKSDSNYLIRIPNFTYNTSAPLSFPAVQSFIPRNLDDSIKAFRDTTARQIRIKLDTLFARRLFNYDTSNAYKTDSIFKARFAGFAVESSNGNSVLGVDFGSVNTKLAIYYNYPKVGGGGRDTTVNYFFFTQVSAAAQYIKRDYSGTPLQASLGGTAPDPIIYMQNTPGTFATVQIPALATMSNRVIHRAELIVEQLYDGSDTVFQRPNEMYVDAYDTTLKNFRTIPYDVAFITGGDFNRQLFGTFPISAKDPSGNSIVIWKFNLSRYVQHVLTKTLPLYDLRLSSQFVFLERTGIPPAAALVGIGVNPTPIKGRVRVAGGTPGPQRMRMRLIYSKL
jgi:hypothetical protein